MNQRETGRIYLQYIYAERKRYHLPLKVLLSVLHDVKVSQVQVDVVVFLTVRRGHVPHNYKWPIAEDRPGRSPSLREGLR